MTTTADPTPAAVAAPVWPLVDGPRHAVTVVAAHSGAVVMRVENPSTSMTPPRAIVLTTRDASGVPNAVRCPHRTAERPFAALAAGDVGHIGDGAVRIGPLHYRAARMVATDAPQLKPVAGGVMLITRAVSGLPRGIDDGPVDMFRSALSVADTGENAPNAGVAAAVRALVGRGTGSTPGGDDVLCGAMAGLHATGRRDLAAIVAAAAVPDAVRRTTLLSAELLRLAGQGQVCTEVRTMLRALACHDGTAGVSGQLDHAIAQVTRLGHTSGVDLMTGLTIGLSCEHTRPTRPHAIAATVHTASTPTPPGRTPISTTRAQQQPIG